QGGGGDPQPARRRDRHHLDRVEAPVPAGLDGELPVRDGHHRGDGAVLVGLGEDLAQVLPLHGDRGPVGRDRVSGVDGDVVVAIRQVHQERVPGGVGEVPHQQVVTAAVPAVRGHALPVAARRVVHHGVGDLVVAAGHRAGGATDVESEPAGGVQRGRARRRRGGHGGERYGEDQ